MKVHGDMIVDQWIFGRELSEECCSCLYMSICSKIRYFCVKYCVQI